MSDIDILNLKNDLIKLRNDLEADIDYINKTTLKDDFGSLDMKSDPMQTKSYSRGKTIGLVIGRDRINNILNSIEGKI
jgi:hypothetical protein